IASWMSYYLLMVVVVFHNEVRYRSAFVPFAFAATAGGIATLADPERRRRVPAGLGLAIGLIVAVGMLRPYAADGWRDGAATRLMAGAREAVARGDKAGAWQAAAEAAGRAPRSARPWYQLGKALDFQGDLAGAVAPYRNRAPR